MSELIIKDMMKRADTISYLKSRLQSLSEDKKRVVEKAKRCVADMETEEKSLVAALAMHEAAQLRDTEALDKLVSPEKKAARLAAQKAAADAAINKRKQKPAPAPEQKPTPPVKPVT
jgi:polyhydroxyalkanoate synthesis regulator protein